jgi:hypothetical protein
MLSGKLVHLIESNWEEILSSVIARIRREPQMEHYRARVEPELREWGQVLLQNLGHWLNSGTIDKIGRRYEELGKQRFEADVPLHESVRVLCIVRERVLDFVEEHVFNKNTLQLYEQEELDRRLGRFFDLLTVHLVKGYEHELRTELAVSARR